MDVVDSRPQDPSIEPEGVKAGPPVVLQVLPRLDTGGVERGTVDTAAAIADAGWVSLVASSGGSMVRELERAGAKHIVLPVESKNPLVMRANVGRLAKLIVEHGVDVIHARSRAPAWSARAAAQRTGAVFMTTFHGDYSGSSVLKRRYNAIMTEGERVIAISEYIAERLQTFYRVPAEKIRTVPRGIDVDLFSAQAVSAERMIQLSTEWRLPDATPVIMLPGRLTRLKGHGILIEALARIGRSDVRCLLVGADQGRTRYRQEIDDHVARAKVSEIVQIAGNCRDMPAAYMLADVVVSASTTPEGFGRVAVEAQAMGRPVIAADHGGARETVIPGETGWLVPPGDPDALAQALREALDMSVEQRERYAERAIANVRRHFTRQRMCADTLDVYVELLNQSG